MPVASDSTPSTEFRTEVSVGEFGFDKFKSHAAPTRTAAAATLSGDG
jgi:hypothetical protein